MPSNTSEIISFFGNAFGAGFDKVINSIDLAPAGGIKELVKKGRKGKKNMRGGSLKSASTLGGGKSPKKRSRKSRVRSFSTDAKSRRLRRVRASSPVRRRLYRLKGGRDD